VTKKRIHETAAAVNLLPYGTGITATGETVIFDRKYRPILIDGQPVDGGFVPYKAATWFYTDRTSPNRCKETRKRLESIVAADPVLSAEIERRKMN
jgi:hypothetical protein